MFRAREITEVPLMDFTLGMDGIPEYIEASKGHYGLFVMDREKGLKNQERQALMRYLKGTLEPRLRGYDAQRVEIEREKKNYYTSFKEKQARKWLDEITKRLSLTDDSEHIKTFDDFGDFESELGGFKMDHEKESFKMVTTPSVPEKKPDMRFKANKVKSFQDVNIENEVVA